MLYLSKVIIGVDCVTERFGLICKGCLCKMLPYQLTARSWCRKDMIRHSGCTSPMESLKKSRCSILTSDVR